MLIRVSNWDILHIAEGQEFSAEKVKAIPASARRRLNNFGKSAGSLADGMIDENPLIVFASRYGDVERSLRILEEICGQEVLSPMNFSLSVHNAVPGVLSIAWKLKEMQSVIAAGSDTFAMGLTESFSLLKSFPHKSVLMIYIDLPLPSVFSDFVGSNEQSGACALLMKTDTSSEGGLVLQTEMQTTEEEGFDNQKDLLKNLSSLLNGEDKKASFGAKSLTWLLEKQDA